MKNSIRYLVPVLGLAVTLPASRAAADDQLAAKQEKKEMRVIVVGDAPGRIQAKGVIISHAGANGEKEIVTFLGVETAPVSPTLTAQLGLPNDAGLVVGHIAPDSPAAGALKEHDILLKLDDQLLIEQRQLRVLIRSHKEGDEVTLTYLRTGKQATAKIKLAKRELPKMALEFNGDMFAPFGNLFGQGNGTVALDDGERALLGMINGGMGVPGTQRMNILHSGGEGERNISVTVNTGNSHVNLDDDQGSLDLTITDGKKQLVAKNKKGEEIFSGPVDTPEQRKALPDDVRGRLEKLEDSTQFSFKSDGDFKAETKVMRPRGQGIAVPPQPPAPGRPPLFF
jgi:serine protease Do